MMRLLLSPFIFVIHITLQLANLALWGGLIILLGLVKLCMPIRVSQRLITPVMNSFLLWFGRVSVFFIRFFNDVTFDYRVNGELNQSSWYLMMANHISYLDIILMIEFASGRIPPPKFFLKKELIWTPFVGLGAWALDMPFMRRYSQAYVEKNPHLKGKDIETTKHYCEKFKTQPTTVINFVEGTRFTPQKHRIKESQYLHLLPPKAGGIAFTLAAMGDLFTNILDVSLAYPDNQKHPMLEMLSGQMKRIIVDVTVLPLTHEVVGDYFNDDQFKHQFQLWLNNHWNEKDKRLSQLLGYQ